MFKIFAFILMNETAYNYILGEFCYQVYAVLIKSEFKFQ